MSKSENEEYEVGKIVRKRAKRTGEIKYYIKWKNYPDNQNTVTEKSPEAVQSAENETTSQTRRVPLKPVVTGKTVFSQFLAKCKETDSSADMDLVVNRLWKRFHQADVEFTSSSFFICLVKKLMGGVSEGPYNQLKSISDELKYRTYRTIGTKNRANKEKPSTSQQNHVHDGVSSKKEKQIRKFEKIMEVLYREILVLKNKEIDLQETDEENSAYIQISRYIDRICQLFEKIGELRSTSVTENPLTTNKKFTDALSVVEKVNETKGVRLSSGDGQRIAELAFRESVEAPKQLRPEEFYTSNCYLPENEEDLATQNSNLKQQLMEHNQKEFRNRIDETIDKYADRTHRNLSHRTTEEGDEEAHSKEECNYSKKISPIPVTKNLVVMELPKWEKYKPAPTNGESTYSSGSLKRGISANSEIAEDNPKKSRLDHGDSMEFCEIVEAETAPVNEKKKRTSSHQLNLENV